MAILSLPVRSDLKSYNFAVDLDGDAYLLRFRYNPRMEAWAMDIATTQNEDIINGIILQTGVPMVEHIASENAPKGAFLLIDETGANLDPESETLGNEVKLLYVEAS